MQNLKVIGVESGALLVATDAGSEYRLPVTLSLQSQLRAANPDPSSGTRKIPPREIQASIRGGRSAEQVATETGVDVDYVRRFEGPVLAEREFVLESARNVPVSVASDDSTLGESSRFGHVIDSRLDAADATDRDWTSYKDPATGWVVHVTYTAAEVEREATWRFDPKKHGLAPLNGDAHTLSRQGSEHTPLVPRLRAVGDHSSDSGGSGFGSGAGPGFGSGVGPGFGPNESGRFDSGAFEVEGDAPETTLPFEGPTAVERSRDPREGAPSAASVAAVNRAPDLAPAHNQTADLLEALRRRRGEREAARFDDGDRQDPRASHPSTGSMRVIDVPLDDFDGPETSVTSAPEGETPEVDPPRVTKPLATHPTASRSRGDKRSDRRGSVADVASAAEQQRTSRARKGRASMPSWDEIVFGARSDDDPA